MPASKTPKPAITLERSYEASLEDVWELWTTREGLESWWGPDRFHAKIHALDLRVGGALDYELITKDPEIVAYLRSMGMPPATRTRGWFTTVEPRTRLAYVTHADFMPGSEPEDIETRVEFRASGGRVHILLSADTFRSPEMTENMELGWKQELEKLASALAG